MNINHCGAVLVTGASRGIGAVMAARLAAAGHTVFAASRQPGAAHRGVVPVALDVTDLDSVAAAASTVHERLDGDGLRAIVNNAAVLHAGPIGPSADSIDEQLRTNIGGVVAVTAAFLPQLGHGSGRIVNVSSINARLPLPYWGVYSATKPAVVALSDAWRMELAPRGIEVSVLTLGAFDTGIRQAGLARWAASGMARLTALAEMIDATATDPGAAADAVLRLVAAAQPPIEVNVGDGIDELVALAAQPYDVRAAAINQLLTATI